MISYGRAIALVGLILIQGAMAIADAGSLQLNVEQAQVTIRAHEVKLGQILEALSHRAGTRVVIDQQSAERPVTIVLEAKSVADAIWELMRRTGGGTYAVLYNTRGGHFETFRLGEDREKTLPGDSLRPSPPHPPGEPRDVAAPLAIPPPGLSSASSISVSPQGSLVPSLPPSASGEDFKLPPSFSEPLDPQYPEDLPRPAPFASPSFSLTPQGSLVPALPPSPSGRRFSLPPSFGPLPAN